MRGTRDSPHHAGVFTSGEGSREFAMATKWLNTTRTNQTSVPSGCGDVFGPTITWGVVVWWQN
jgi:hypothetical protein